MNAISPSAARLDGAAFSRSSTNPDSLLINLCADYIALERADRAELAVLVDEAQRDAYYRRRPLPWSDEARNAPDKLLMQQIARLPARTPEGVKAKADALVWMYGGNDEHTPYGDDTADSLYSLLRDITGKACA